MSSPYESEVTFVAELIRQAGAMTLDYFRRGVSARLKDDATPVTAADEETEIFIRRHIRSAFPEDGLLGEEGEDQPGTSDRRWIIDPIDGTKSFISGVPLYALLIGLEEAGQVVLGALHLPALGETLLACRGQGCWHNGHRTRVSTVSTLEQARLVYTEISGFDKAGEESARAFETLRRTCRMTRGWGDAYGYFLVATGRADIMLDPFMAPWDCGPLPVILTEAGGRFSDWTGRVAIDGGHAVGTNALLYDDVLRLLPNRRARES